MRTRLKIGNSSTMAAQRVLDDREAAALAVAGVGVDAGADHQIALVGLADVAVHGVATSPPCASTGLIGSDTSACSGWLSIGRRRPAIAASTLEWPAATTPTFFAPMKPRLVSTPTTCAAVAADAGDLAVLDDVDAARVGAARVAPGDRVVARDAAAPLQRGAEDRIARVRRVLMIGTIALTCAGVEHLAVDAVQPVGVDAARRCRACPAACGRGSARRAG